MRYNKILLLVTFILTGLLGQKAFSQRINTYTKQTFSAAWNSIASSGTVLTTNCSGCDDYGYIFTLPFSFKYDNVTFSAGSSTSVTTNGYMRLGIGTTASGCCSNNLGSSSYYNGLMVMSEDQYVSGELYYQTSGNAPNRILTVEWDYVRAYSGNGQYTSWQIKLYETSNTIEFIYKDNSFTMGGDASGVGLNGTNTPSFIYVSHGVSNQTPSTDLRWSAIPDRQLEVTPEFVDFGYHDGGEVFTADITVRSVGTAPDPVLINNVVISTGHPDFVLLSTPPSSLSPGQSATFTVQWTAQGAGPRAAVLLVQSNGRDSGDQLVSLSGYTRSSVIQVSATQLFNKKRVRLGETITEDLLIKNIGEAPLKFTQPNAFDFQGEDAPMYTVVRSPMDPIPPGVEDTLRIAFTPTVEGVRQADLFIHNNSSNNQDVYVKLKGTGILPHIVVTPDPMDFDSVEIGTVATMKFTIYNPGTDTLILLRNEFTSADPDFVLTPLTGADTRIAPEHSREVTVTFTPLQRGTRVARFHVVTNVPFTFEQPRRDTATTVLYYDIRGTGIPVGTLEADISDDGIIDSSLIGVEKCRAVTITNSGDADVTITGTTFVGAAAGDYSVKGITYPYTLKAKSSVTVQVCATPSARGSNLVSMTVTGTSNDKPNTLQSAVDVIGLLACGERAPVTAFENSVIQNSLSDTAIVTVTNCGDVAATFNTSIAGTNAGLYSVSAATVGPIAPGATAQVTVIFTPDTRGAKSATLTFTDVAGNIAPMTVDLSGQGACAVPASDQATFSIEEAVGKTLPTEFNITITNNGNLAWDPGTPTVTPTDVFKYVNGPGQIAPGGSGTMVLSFHPATATDYTAAVTFVGSGPCEENALTINLTGKGITSDVSDVRRADGYGLTQNAPNPVAAGVTTFSYTVPEASSVRILLADVTGKTVRELVNTRVSAGTYSVDVNTSGLASGTYLYIMEAGTARLVKQMAVSK